MNNYFKNLSGLIGTKTSHQTFSLFAAQLYGGAIGFFVNMWLAGAMGVVEYGRYSFSLALLSFCAIFFEFGYFTSGAKILAESSGEQRERDLNGILVIIFSGIAIGFTLVILGVSLTVDAVFQDKIGAILGAVWFISFSFMISSFLDLILKGYNNIGLLVAYHLICKSIFVLFILGFTWWRRINPVSVLTAFSISGIMAFIYCLVKIKPAFHNIKGDFKTIQQLTKSFGWNVYSGKIFAVAAYNLDKILLSYFAGAADVGIYMLAFSFANPISIFATSLAGSKFKAFSKRPISGRLLRIHRWTIGLMIVGIMICAYLIVRFYLGPDYHKIIQVLPAIIGAVAFQSAYQPYNAWLTCNGFGKELKIIAFKFTFAGILANIALIYSFGIYGAAVSSLMVMIYAFIMHRQAYRRLRTDNIGLNR